MDRRELHLIVRPLSEREGKKKGGMPDNQAVVLLKDWDGTEHWFHLELARVWPLELDG